MNKADKQARKFAGAIIRLYSKYNEHEFKFYLDELTEIDLTTAIATIYIYCKSILDPVGYIAYDIRSGRVIDITSIGIIITITENAYNSERGL